MGMINKFEYPEDDDDYSAYGSNLRRRFREDGEDANSYNAGWIDGRDHTKKAIAGLIEKLKADSQVPGKHTEFVTYKQILKMIKSYGI